ncbi:CPBP family intramembrane metalloprotease [Sphingomonas lutea]|uniref:CPBP family intramembrane metalloprotease n=1 Tax=Sphingomonas lutea TaxID=1045317 RepID=A0A7G9SHF1_9SPHN|nr:CPBP family intramembrane glutamic endopeptidase [Sphingomonas lutea]QNN67276.1 CPBP family intramembrane metalloprotease [Sphingomonas lutea]
MTHSRNWGIAREVALGLGVAILGIGPWALLAPLNARIRPDLPWAAAATLILLALLAWWLAGGGPPRASRDARWRTLRLWSAGGPERAHRWSAETWMLILVFVALTAAWIGLSGGRPLPDGSQYPTTAFRISAFVMTPLVAGVAEEMAYRGFMFSRLERFGPETAMVVTSAVFAAAHLVHGLGVLVLLPGFFLISLIYCALVRRTGSILPGMALHMLGDAAYLLFAVLGGNIGWLFATS